MARRLAHNHPTLTIFALLAPSMGAMLLLILRDVALEPAQRASLVAATILVAAASAWVITRD